MARRSYSKPHSVGFETVKSSKCFPAARCAASASLSRFGARFQLVRFANMNCAGTLGGLLPDHYIRALQKTRITRCSRILYPAYLKVMSTPSRPNPLPQPVPQFDLSAQYAAIGGEIRTAVERVMASQQFVLGREGAALEEEIARLCGVAHGVGLASGTDALILALRACGVHSGDEVLLPSFTFVATGSAVSALGARPVFADIRPDTYNIDPAEF